MPGASGNPLKKLGEASSFWAGAVAACIEKGYDAKQARSVLVKCAQTDPALVHEFNQIAAALDEETASAPYPVMEKSAQEPGGYAGRETAEEAAARFAESGIDLRTRPWMRGMSDIELALYRAQREVDGRFDDALRRKPLVTATPPADRRSSSSGYQPGLHWPLTIPKGQTRSYMTASWKQDPGQLERYHKGEIPLSQTYLAQPYGILKPITQAGAHLGQGGMGLLGTGVGLGLGGLGYLGSIPGPYGGSVFPSMQAFGDEGFQGAKASYKDFGAGLNQFFGGDRADGHPAYGDWVPPGVSNVGERRHKVFKETGAPSWMYTAGDIFEQISQQSASAAIVAGAPVGIAAGVGRIPAMARAASGATGLGRVTAPLGVFGRAVGGAYSMGKKIPIPVPRPGMLGATIPLLGPVGESMTKSQFGVALLIEGSPVLTPAVSTVDSMWTTHSYDEASTEVINNWYQEQREKHKKPWYAGTDNHYVNTFPVKQRFLFDMRMRPELGTARKAYEAGDSLDDPNALFRRVTSHMRDNPGMMNRLEFAAIEAREQRLNIPMTDGYFAARWKVAPSPDNPEMMQEYFEVLHSLAYAKRMHNRMLFEASSIGKYWNGLGLTNENFYDWDPPDTWTFANNWRDGRINDEQKAVLKRRYSGQFTRAQAEQYLKKFLDPEHAPDPWGELNSFIDDKQAEAQGLMPPSGLAEGTQVSIKVPGPDVRDISVLHTVWDEKYVRNYSLRGRQWVPLDHERTESLIGILSGEKYLPRDAQGRFAVVDPDMASALLATHLAPGAEEVGGYEYGDVLVSAPSLPKYRAARRANFNKKLKNSWSPAQKPEIPYISPVLDIPVSTEY